MTAVDALTVEVVPGLVTGFLEPNGSGKSTTMRMALGLDRPDRGQVRVNGRRYRELRWPLREVVRCWRRRRSIRGVPPEHPGTGVLVLSQYIETRYATTLLAGNASGVGYLLGLPPAEADNRRVLAVLRSLGR